MPDFELSNYLPPGVSPDLDNKNFPIKINENFQSLFRGGLRAEKGNRILLTDSDNLLFQEFCNRLSNQLKADLPVSARPYLNPEGKLIKEYAVYLYRMFSHVQHSLAQIEELNLDQSQRDHLNNYVIRDISIQAFLQQQVSERIFALKYPKGKPYQSLNDEELGSLLVSIKSNDPNKPNLDDLLIPLESTQKFVEQLNFDQLLQLFDSTDGDFMSLYTGFVS